jgi:hypothetical protein
MLSSLPTRVCSVRDTWCAQRMAEGPQLQVFPDALNLHRGRQHGHLRVATHRKGARDRPACLDGYKRVIQPTMEECFTAYRVWF